MQILKKTLKVETFDSEEEMAQLCLLNALKVERLYFQKIGSESLTVGGVTTGVMIQATAIQHMALSFP